MYAGDAVGTGGIVEAASEPVAVAVDIGESETGAEKAAAVVLVVGVEPAVPAVASEQIATGKECLLLVRHSA